MNTHIQKTHNLNIDPSRPGILQTLENQCGVTVIMVLLFLVVLSAMAPIAVQRTALDIKKTGNFKSGKALFYVADAGIQHGLNILAEKDDDNWNDELALDGGKGTILNANAFGGGTYTVTVKDNWDEAAATWNDQKTTDVDKVLNIESEGTLNGDTKTVRVMVRAVLDTYSAPGGIVSDGDLKIGGNPTVLGLKGDAHANGDILINGNPKFKGSGNVSAKQVVTITGSPEIDGTTTNGAAPVNVPAVTPADYKGNVDFIFTSDCKIYDGRNEILPATNPPTYTLIANVGSGNKWNNWECKDGDTPKNWGYGDSGNPPDASYYCEGCGFRINGDPGSVSTPWEVTLIADLFIQISGNPIFKNHKDATYDSEGIQNLMLIAGTDIMLNGNPDQAVEGIIYAGEQFRLNGDPKINGPVICKNKTPGVETMVPDDPGCEINGNPTITYNGGMATPFGATGITLTTLAWQEIS